jgi:hypothetical protein
VSLTPTTPNLPTVAKSFWDRKEGTTGKIVLAALALGVGGALLFGWGLILPFLIGVAGNTLQLAIFCGLLLAITSPIWSSRIRLLTRLAFQQTCRWMTGMFIQIDPIGILRQNITDIRSQVQEFDKAVSSISGVRQRLYDDIEAQKNGIEKNRGLVSATDKQMAMLQKQIDSAPASLQPSSRALQEVNLKLESMRLQKQNYASLAGFQIQTIKTEQPLLESADEMYNKLSRIRQLAAARADGLTQQTDLLEKRHAMMQSVGMALRAGNKILKGDPNQQALIEQDIDYLNNEASDTLGALADFNKWSDGYLTDMDIQNGAAAEGAFKVFAQMEQKMSQPLELPNATAVVVPDFDSPEIQKLLK